MKSTLAQLNPVIEALPLTSAPMYEYSTVVLSKVAEPTTLKIVRPLETVTQDASISPLDDTRKPSHRVLCMPITF